MASICMILEKECVCVCYAMVLTLLPARAYDKMVKVYGSLLKPIEFMLKLKAWEEKTMESTVLDYYFCLVENFVALTDIERTKHSHRCVPMCVCACISWYVHRLKFFVCLFVSKVWLWKCKTVFYFNIELTVISRLIHCCCFMNARNKDMPCHAVPYLRSHIHSVCHYRWRLLSCHCNWSTASANLRKMNEIKKKA